MPRIIADQKRRRTGIGPRGLDTAPGRVVWDQYVGAAYYLFIDESFFEFFGLANPDGNFTYGTVGVPVQNIGQFNQGMAKLLEQYQHQASLASPSFIATEFKATHLTRLDSTVALRFVKAIAQLIREVGGFVSGYFVPVSGIIMERVRTKLIDSKASVPKQHTVLYQEARSELLPQLTGERQAYLIVRLLQVPASSIAIFLGYLQASFTIVYDPRERHEDQIVRSAMAEYLDLVARIPYGDEAAQYNGLDLSQTSERSFGLQAADLIAGLVRQFFRFNKAAVEHKASLKLITPTSKDSLVELVNVEGQWFKMGALTQMHPSLIRSLAVPNDANPLSYFSDLLASGIISCMTSIGRYRHIEIFNAAVFDLLD